MSIFRQKQKRDTASGWNTANPILLDGEIGYITDTGRFKVGDGITNFIDLPYAAGEVTNHADNVTIVENSELLSLNIGYNNGIINNAIIVSKDTHFGHYQSIQSAINAASPTSGQIQQIHVYPGTYLANLVLKDGISIVGVGAKGSVIIHQDSSSSDVITMNAAMTCSISNVTLRKIRTTSGVGSVIKISDSGAVLNLDNVDILSSQANNYIANLITSNGTINGTNVNVIGLDNITITGGSVRLQGDALYAKTMSISGSSIVRLDYRTIGMYYLGDTASSGIISSNTANVRIVCEEYGGIVAGTTFRYRTLAEMNEQSSGGIVCLGYSVVDFTATSYVDTPFIVKESTTLRILNTHNTKGMVWINIAGRDSVCEVHNSSLKFNVNNTDVGLHNIEISRNDAGGDTQGDATSGGTFRAFNSVFHFTGWAEGALTNGSPIEVLSHNAVFEMYGCTVLDDDDFARTSHPEDTKYGRIAIFYRSKSVRLYNNAFVHIGDGSAGGSGDNAHPSEYSNLMSIKLNNSDDGSPIILDFEVIGNTFRVSDNAIFYIQTYDQTAPSAYDRFPVVADKFIFQNNSGYKNNAESSASTVFDYQVITFGNSLSIRNPLYTLYMATLMNKNYLNSLSFQFGLESYGFSHIREDLDVDGNIRLLPSKEIRSGAILAHAPQWNNDYTDDTKISKVIKNLCTDFIYLNQNGTYGDTVKFRFAFDALSTSGAQTGKIGYIKAILTDSEVGNAPAGMNMYQLEMFWVLDGSDAGMKSLTITDMFTKDGTYPYTKLDHADISLVEFDTNIPAIVVKNSLANTHEVDRLVSLRIVDAQYIDSMVLSTGIRSVAVVATNGGDAGHSGVTVTKELMSIATFSPVNTGVCYSHTNTLPSVSDSHTTETPSVGTNTTDLLYLTPKTDYYFRAYSTDGTTVIYGDLLMFRTL